MKPKSDKLDAPADAAVAISTRAEQKQVEERVAISANVVYEAIRREGDDELRRAATALAWSAFAAGLSMGFSFVAEALLTTYLPNQPWVPLISRAGYSVGFLIVILGRQQLFTENTLTVILPLLLDRRIKVLLRVMRLWGIVLGANLVGTCIFAFVLAHLPVFDPHTQETFVAIASAHMGRSFGIVLLRGIFAGWLIALMVWLLPAAEQSRVAVIVIVTYLVGLGGLTHIVAGSTVMFYGVATHMLSWSGYFTRFLVPVFIGNVTGGVSLVAALAHGQVIGGKEPTRDAVKK
jgi:formate/nitrite transporter FocA (FNT family)